MADKDDVFGGLDDLEDHFPKPPKKLKRVSSGDDDFPVPSEFGDGDEEDEINDVSTRPIRRVPRALKTNVADDEGFSVSEEDDEEDSSHDDGSDFLSDDGGDDEVVDGEEDNEDTQERRSFDFKKYGIYAVALVFLGFVGYSGYDYLGSFLGSDAPVVKSTNGQIATLPPNPSFNGSKPTLPNSTPSVTKPSLPPVPNSTSSPIVSKPSLPSTPSGQVTTTEIVPIKAPVENTVKPPISNDAADKLSEKIKSLTDTIERLSSTSSSLDERLKSFEVRLSSVESRAVSPTTPRFTSDVPVKPRVLSNWVLKGVSKDVAWISDGKSPIKEVHQGDIINDGGVVKAITQYEQDWVVMTDQGIIVRK